MLVQAIRWLGHMPRYRTHRSRQYQLATEAWYHFGLGNMNEQNRERVSRPSVIIQRSHDRQLELDRRALAWAAGYVQVAPLPDGRARACP